MGSVQDSVLDKFRLGGKNIVITGGSRGLGLEFARALTSVGANIAAIDLGDGPSEEFSALASLYKESKFRYYKSNVVDYGHLKQTVDQIHQDFGSIDGW
jgi:NAD(P)-dependent dehydrogenase (short-subunit alcohol dehydrogenase family)